ncbi:UPF0149 family protein [Pseudoalteromonas tunicata]|uniref:YecA family protein n=1 Tax=Pseudoalteromonas tunicata D2 TaxID=87626 RepID=A4CCL7_9GAMM|nr:UPF0149 family protein [Pseudoalteromonas tunicata]ATC93811.1 hypothetical protein PTUN_a1134 [Pseudoalteromonas tunicata]AXT29630.1 YecA family protein [Pseudoalteromonas tunicata]EAR27310.1 hypothetical protein PTD2_14762 [Pseudoalteromonas tunicata D2]MDP4982950.1 UPF0149 family protein [Pseudoalteromonas tunicata]MDP5214920.1 UPF0149 family protein [Pseudoalteromonas tunicata]
MIENLTYQEAQLLLEKHQVFVMPSEVHGVISGLLACGLEIESTEYLSLLSDVFNEGQAFQTELKTFLVELYKQVTSKLSDRELHFELYLPDDDESLADQANAVVAWIAGFLLGFGLKQKDYGRLSDDVKEVIQDFTEISKLDTHFDETEEDSQSLYEIIEYVRISTLLCFAELGEKQVTSTPTNKTIH